MPESDDDRTHALALGRIATGIVQVVSEMPGMEDHQVIVILGRPGAGASATTMSREGFVAMLRDQLELLAMGEKQGPPYD